MLVRALAALTVSATAAILGTTALAAPPEGRIYGFPAPCFELAGA